MHDFVGATLCGVALALWERNVPTWRDGLKRMVPETIVYLLYYVCEKEPNIFPADLSSLPWGKTKILVCGARCRSVLSNTHSSDMPKPRFEHG